MIGEQTIAVFVGKFSIDDRELVSRTPAEAGVTRTRGRKNSI